MQHIILYFKRVFVAYKILFKKIASFPTLKNIKNQKTLLYYYFKSIGISLSSLINVILGGDPYQTFSARNYEWKRTGKYNLVWFIDRLLWLDKNHCLHCWANWMVNKEKK